MAPKTHKAPNRKLPTLRQFTPSQAAPYFGVTARRVVAMCHEKKLIADLIDGIVWLIPRSEVEREIARRRNL